MQAKRQQSMSPELDQWGYTKRYDGTYAILMPHPYPNHYRVEIEAKLTKPQAESIVRACNSHDELIAASTKALHYMRLHKYADQAWADDLEAALAKAKS